MFGILGHSPPPCGWLSGVDVSFLGTASGYLVGSMPQCLSVTTGKVGKKGNDYENEGNARRGWKSENY